jgi:hypothetical protein
LVAVPASAGCSVANWAWGLVWCITIIGIPLGLANFKMIAISLFPMGKDIVSTTAVTSTSGTPVGPPRCSPGRQQRVCPGHDRAGRVALIRHVATRRP